MGPERKWFMHGHRVDGGARLPEISYSRRCSGFFSCVTPAVQEKLVPCPLGWGGGGKRNTQDDLTCLNQNRQVDLSLYACEHWHTILSGVSYNVTLYQGGQVHSPCQSSASYEAPETSTKRIRVSLNLSVPMALWRLEGTLLY